MPSRKDWFTISEIDYYSAFIKLWLSFNALYKDLYHDETNLRTDRHFIEKLKTSDNRIRKQFIKYFDPSDESNDAKEFRHYLQLFIRHYGGDIIGSEKIIKDEEKGIKPQMNGSVVDEICFANFIHPKNFTLKSNKINGYLKIEKLYIKDTPELLWETFLEILYMNRNLLVHGVLEPSDKNHKIVQSSYILLRHLIKDKV